MKTDEVTYPEGATKVLDKGFVRLVDCMGDDSSICQAARVSYSRGTKSVREDETLIRYLMRHKHTSPFEMVELKFHCRIPIFVARQWIRHRTASVNEMSARYSEMPEWFYEPSVADVTTQSAQNRQGSCAELVESNTELVSSFSDLYSTSYNQYKEYLSKNMRRELARIVLPLSLYTEWYWKINLRNLFHFLKLRLDRHAQYEIRVYAEAIAQIVSKRVPISWKAFEEYELKSMTITLLEQDLLRKVVSGQKLTTSDVEQQIPNKREQEEFVAKLRAVGAKVG